MLWLRWWVCDWRFGLRLASHRAVRCNAVALGRTAAHGPVDLALFSVNGLSAFGRRLVMSAAEAVEAAAAAGAHTLVAIHDAHFDDPVWRFIRRRSTARDCLPTRDRIAPQMAVQDLPTGHRAPIAVAA